MIFAKDEKEDKKTNKKQNAFDITDPDGSRLEKEKNNQLVEKKKEELLAEVQKLSIKKIQDKREEMKLE